MKNVLKIFAVLSAFMFSFTSCNKGDLSIEPEQKLFYVTFTAEEPDSRTTVEQGTDENDKKVAYFSWTNSDADSSRWTVYRGVEEATSVTASLSEGVMTLTAGFGTPSVNGDTFVALFNKGVNSVQNITLESVYDPTSDVMISAEVQYVAGQDSYGFCFNRLGAIGKATVKGLVGMEAVTEAKLIATDGTVLAADYDYSSKEFEETGSTSICIKDIDCDPDDSGYFEFYFITVPVESVNVKMLVYAMDGETEERLYVKQLGRPIGFEKGNVHAFNVSGFTEVTTRASFNVNGEVNSKLVYQGEPIEFPEAPAKILDYDFVGWSSTSLAEPQQEAPEMVDVENQTMGNQNVTYYAVYAKETQSEILEKLGSDATLKDGDTISVFAQNNSIYYGMYQETVSNSYVNYFTLDHEPVLEDIISDSKRSWNLTQVTGGWYLGDETNGYLSNSTNNLYVKNEDIATVQINSTDAGWTIKNSDRWIACRADLTGDNQYKYRGAGNSNNPQTNSIAYFDIYRIGTEDVYSGYCTSIETRIPTVLEWSDEIKNVTIGAVNNYPTLITTPDNLSGVTYSSSITSCATIDSETGVINLVSPGTTIITASFEGNEEYQPAEAATYTLNVSFPVTHTVTFSVNGTATSQSVLVNSSIEFPEVSDISDVIKFKGWATEVISGTQVDSPDMVDTEKETMGDSDITYYAVFATEGNSVTWEEITSTPEEGEYAICSDSYFMKAAVNSNRFENGSATPQISGGKLTTAPAIDCIWEISKPDTYYRIKNGTNYAGGTSVKNQGALLADSSQDLAKWTISYNNQFEIINYGRSIATSDSNNKYLRNNTNSGWATYASGTGSAPRLFKKVETPTFTDYCTTVKVLLSIAVSGTPTTTTYKEGDKFDPTGLVVTGTYSDHSTETITDGITWSTPAALTEGQTSVSITATVRGITSEAYEVTGLTVTGSSKTKDNTAKYTLNPTAGSNNQYTGNCDVLVDGITWNVTGNAQVTPWRIGGKSISKADRTVYSKTAYAKELWKVSLTVGAASSITVNSLKLVYSTNANFSNSTEISKSFAENSTIDFEADFPKNCYYKFVFNVTVSGSSNKFVEFKKVEFFGYTE